MSDHKRIRPDPLLAGEAPLAEGESLKAEWRGDAGIYWRNHLILAALFSVLALAVLWQIGNPYPWTGPLAAIVAVFARAAFLRSEALGDRWRLTDRRLLGPRGRIAPLSSVASVRPLLGDVLVITAGGDKHLLKYLADPASVIATLNAARTRG